MNNKNSKNNKIRQAKVNQTKNDNDKQTNEIKPNKEINELNQIKKFEPKKLNDIIKNKNTSKNDNLKFTNNNQNNLKTEINKSTNNNQTKQDLAHINNDNSQNQPKKHQQKSFVVPAIIIFSLTFLVAILSKILGGKMVEGRTNPPAYPPDWLFSVAWAILYVLIAFATFIVYKNTLDKNKRKCRMIWYCIHLFFNLFWPLFYFRLDQLIISCFILLSMVITAIVLTFKYFKNNLLSGTLFTIYTLWLLYAMYLNLGITLINI